MTIRENLEQAAAVVREKLGGFQPEISLTLGSGLGYMVTLLADAQSCAYADIPWCPTPTVPGHEGRLWWGVLSGRKVAMLQGRSHLYEGRSVHEVVFTTRLVITLGVKRLILTHATGALTQNLEPGDIVGIHSQIGLNCPDPTSGPGVPELGVEFVSPVPVFDPELLRIAKLCALEERVSFHRGVSHFKLGRTFETVAETFAMARAGADVATMSTVPEVLAAAQMGAVVLDLALVTDMCPGLGSATPVKHEEVLAVAEANKAAFGRLITAVVGQMGD